MKLDGKVFFIPYFCTGLLIGTTSLVSKADEQPIEKLSGIVVTGSHIRRTDKETPSPVQVITQDDIQKIGATSTEDLLQLITSNANSISSTETLSFMAGESSVDLRGLGSQDSLVLLNGRRVAPYGRPNVTNQNIEPSVNLNSIPVSAIDRVEVLINGGSAIYGSDALGGVVNIITKKRFKGIEINGYFGETTHGDDPTTNISLTGGFKDGPSSGLMSFNFRENGVINESDRSISASSDSTALGGLDFNSPVGNPPTITATDTGGNQLPINLCKSNSADQTNPNLICETNRNAYTEYVPASRTVSWYSNLNRELASTDSYSLSAYFEGLLNKASTTTHYYPSPVSTSFDNVIAGATNPIVGQLISAYSTAKGTTLDPTKDVPIEYDFAAAGPRTDVYDDLQQRYVLGLKGDLFSSWTYDAAALYSSDDNTDIGTNYISKPLIEQALTTGLSLTNASGVTQTEYFNPFGAVYGLSDNSPEMVNALKVRLNTLGKSKIESVDAVVSGPLVHVMNHDISLALGLERRLEYYENDPDSQQSGNNVLGLSSGTPISGSRALLSTYSELDIPISHYGEIQAAVRHESYSDFGGVTKPKVAIKLTPVKWLIVRGGIDQGFRAPSLADLYSAQFSGFQNALVDTPRCNAERAAGQSQKDCNGSQLYRITAGGNPALKPEQSISYYYGMVLEPIPGDSIAIDTFDIRVDDVVTQLNPQTLIDQNSPGTVQRGASQFAGDPGPILNVNDNFLNGAELITRGFDIDGTYRVPASLFPTKYGELSAKTSWTYFGTYIYSDAATPPQNYAGSDLYGIALPRWKGNAQFDYEYAEYGATFRINYVGDYDADYQTYFTLPDGTSLPAGTIPAHTTFDVQGTWKPQRLKGVRFILGIENITDVQPPFSVGANAYSAGFMGFDPTLYSNVGRFLYGNIDYRF